MIEPNIIVLDNNERIIRWLDSDLCDIEETNAENKCRSIKLSYPYESNVILEGQKQWYEQGNKIFVPSLNGVTACLYVINTDYEIDFWKENTITLEAEEVLTEMNYDVISFPSASVFDVTKAKLEEWFGSYYDIGTIDTLNNKRKKVSPEGVLTYMSLFRMIEEQTERKFITEYDVDGTSITRTLNLVNTEKETYTAPTDILDLNYNLSSLEFIKSEENTYNAIAPVFNTSNTVTGTEVNESKDLTNLVVRRAEQSTENLNRNIRQLNELLESANANEGAVPEATVTSKTADELLTEWLEYEVETGQEIPMIIKEDKDGNIIRTATWSAPFTKRAGELFMCYEGEDKSDYTNIMSYNRTKSNDKYKVCTSTTSQTLMESIYNDLALALLGKLTPKFELKIDVKDIQELLGTKNLQYKVHEKLEVRVPNFDYYVPCKITETTKNLHLPGENKIKVETDVTSMLKMYNSIIQSNDIIISSYDISQELGGVLLGSDDIKLADKNITINLKLVKSYDTETVENNSTIQQAYSKFDPVNETYYFSEQELQKLEKMMRNTKIEGSGVIEGSFRLKSVDGQVYNVPNDWAICLYYARNQLYVNNETVYGGIGGGGLGKGYFESSVECHQYTDVKNKIKITNTSQYEASKKYYVSWFKYMMEINEEFWIEKGFPPATRITSSEAQNGPTCMPASISNVTSYFRTYHTEAELAKLMGTSTTGTNRNNAEKVIQDLGFKLTIVEANEANIKKYLLEKQVISLSIVPSRLGSDYYNNYYQPTGDSSHAIVLFDWYQLEGQPLMVRVLDTNLPIYNPLFAYNSSHELIPMKTEWMAASTVLQAVCGHHTDSGWSNIIGEITHHMTVIENTTSNRASEQEIEAGTVNVSFFNPEVTQYNFSINSIRDTIKDSIQSNVLNDVDDPIMNLYPSISTVEGTKYQVTMTWLRAMCYAYMFSYFDKTDKSSNKTVHVNKDSVTSRYYNRFNTDLARVGSYDWFTPCKVTSNDYQRGYIVATLLFNLGIAHSFNDFLVGDNTFSSISTTLKNTAGKSLSNNNLKTWIISNTKTQIKKYLSKAYHDNFMYTVLFAYAKNDNLKDHSNLNLTSYPVMLYSVDGENIEYQNLMGTGNSSSSYYSTTSTNATHNPYGVTSIDNMVSWISNASSEAPSGSANQILVVSWFNKKTLDGGE